MEAVVLHRVGVLECFCRKQGQDIQPAVAPLHPEMSQAPFPAPRSEIQPRVKRFSLLHDNFKTSLKFPTSPYSHSL